MKILRVSGMLCLVTDLGKTIDFYEKLGFSFSKRTQDYATAYLNQFWLEFVAHDKAEKTVFQKEANLQYIGPRGAGLFVHINVDNVDEFHEAMLAKGLKLSSEPQDFPWGRREFVMGDPDGYKLVFFQKK